MSAATSARDGGTYGWVGPSAGEKKSYKKTHFRESRHRPDLAMQVAVAGAAPPRWEMREIARRGTDGKATEATTMYYLCCTWFVVVFCPPQDTSVAKGSVRIGVRM